MEATIPATVTVETLVKAPAEKVWRYLSEPKHITKWNNASEDWHTTHAENDLREGGKFVWRMEAKDGSFGFDFSGKYDVVKEHELIEYTLDDGRKVKITLTANGNETKVVETFEADSSHSVELQRSGWQAILDNFRKYVEESDKLQRLNFQVSINAPVEKVFHTMLREDTYRQWTSLFCPTSYFVGSWDKGSKILFIGVDDKGNKGGMVSRIKENIPNKFVSIEHLGVLEGDTEVTSGPAVEGWAGALENYNFDEQDGKTIVSVDVDSNADFVAFMDETYPKALEKLKEICEEEPMNS